MKMAASRMSRIADHRLTLLSLLVAMVLAPTSSLSNVPSPPESVEDAEVIPEHIELSAADGDISAAASPFDLKKYNSNSKKFQKFYPKTETEWNFKGEGKKTDVYIKDPKDNRLLRLISEGLVGPQDILPIVSNDAIVSSQKTVSNGEINVTVQPEGMSGIVDDGLTADSDEKIIMEKKKNATKEKVHQHKLEMDASRESEENIKINLDANAGVQNPLFTKHKDSITVPAQKQISLSKGKESHVHKRLNDASYDVVSLHKPKDRPSSTDEGVFDFVDTPLSNKNLVPAGTAQTSRINVKKGPNGQDYEYEYVYYYYYDDPEDGSKRDGSKPFKSNEITASVSSSTPAGSKTASSTSRYSSTPAAATRFTKTYDANLGTRIKSTDVLNEATSVRPQTGRDKFSSRPDSRYSIDNTAEVSPYPKIPNKPIASNDLSWQYDQNNRFPGRQIPPQSIVEQSQAAINEEAVSSTRQPGRGRLHYNTLPLTTTDDSSYLITAQPVSTISPPRETQTRSRVGGNFKQQKLELEDNNSIRTYSTRVPSDYEQFPTPVFENPAGKSIKQNSESTVSQNIPSGASSTKGDILKTKTSTIEYAAGNERFQSTSPPFIVSSSSVETTGADSNTAPQSTLQEGTLTTVYGAGLTDKAAHDLYAIYQQTQNEESVRNTIAQDDRTTVIDEAEGTRFIATNQPVTTVFVFTTTTTSTTTTPPPPPTTTTPTTTTTTPTPATSVVQTGKGRFRGSSPRGRHTTSTTEAVSATSETTEKTRSRFQPQNRREQGHRISAYGKKSTTVSSDGEISSSSTSSPDASTRHGYSSRNRYRGSTNLRSENTSAEPSTSAPSHHHTRPSYSERFNSSRKRPGLRSSTVPTPSSAADEESTSVKPDVSSEASSADGQQSTTFRSTRNKYNHNQQVRPLRPGPKINFAGRGRLGTSSTTAAVPLDADTSGSADIPVEQRQGSSEGNSDSGEGSSDTASSATQLQTTVSTVQPDTFHKLKNRPKLRISDRSTTAKVQQSNVTVAPNQNRRNLANNLLPRKKSTTTTTESQDLKEEKVELSPRPVSEDVEETESQQATEASSTTESKLSALLASRRRNLSRKPGTIVHTSKQTATEES